MGHRYFKAGLAFSCLPVLALLVILNGSPKAITPAPAITAESYQSVECWFTAPEQWQVSCGQLHTGPERGGFVLPVVVIVDGSPDRRPDPLVYLTGGPGSSSLLEPGSIKHWFYWLEAADIKRDFVLVDQRGTGGSEPAFRCQSYEAGLRRILATNLTLEEEHRAQFALAKECFASLRTQGWSPDSFSTSHSARDMAAVLEALGYSEWNVMGGSYGSRLALEWLRQEESHIRAVILDSVYPLDKGSLADWPALLDKSLAAFWAHCQRRSWCDAQTPQRFHQALARLQAGPRNVSVPLYSGGWPVPLVLNDHRFLSAVYNALYDESLHPHILAAMQEVFEGGDESLGKLAANAVNGQLTREFNPMVYLAVDCAESLPLSREDYEAARSRYPAWSAYTDHAWDYDMCRLVPPRPDLADFKQSFSTSVPALILSGGLDPVTPSGWAFELAEAMPKALHWHLPDAGHGISSSRACVHEALGRFLDAPEQNHPFPCDIAGEQ